jgi:DNA topoisomerase I
MRLRRVDVCRPGLTRRRRGSGFSYHYPDGTPVVDPDVLDRIRALAIPPAWRDVWICPLPNGHIQAVGTDAAGRRQYRYHDYWREVRDSAKFDRVLRLAARLPRLRAHISAALAQPGLGRDRVLSAALRMVDLAVFRVGGEEYLPADDYNGSYGLATLRRDHVRVQRGAVYAEYVGKGGVEQAVVLRDPALHKVVVALLRRRGGGEDLLAYRNGDGWRDVRADDVNIYLKELVGEEFTAKDLRTWHATVLAATSLAVQASADGVLRNQRTRQRAVVKAMREVADHLGNTPAVARKSYVDPHVMECFERGVTVARAVQRAGSTDLSDDQTREVIERAVLHMLRRAH